MNAIPNKKPRPLLAVLLLFTIPILIGAAISPSVFNFLRELGETTDSYQKLTTASFERITNRCVMLVAVIILYPVIRMTGLWPDVKKGLAPSSERMRDLYASMLIGGLSMSMVFLVGWQLGAFEMSPRLPGIGKITAKVAGFATGAVFIGVFEEIFFRGFVFGALRIRLGFTAALVVSSIIFSGIHFFRPMHPEEITVAEWSSGFALIPHMFARFEWERDMMFATTLFVMGLTLATFYHRRGNLYFIIGLHGSWVLAMQAGAFIFNRKRDVLPVWFGDSDFASKGLLALIIVSIFYGIALRSRKRVDS
ncbi:MAG TPA: CPBP family intramembrane metalloprotease [Kiritimatiellia bacterium]|nr:CPBP family intramembrane metalloprotease [Kiritimatiellia bacterium]